MFKRLILFSFFMIFSSLGQAADLVALKELFQSEFNSLYAPRMCGENIGRLILAAQKKKIDLSNSYVLRFQGGGFLETSGFYTRQKPNDRVMLGYFHFVLVADGHVFDFDLNEPLVLNLHQYVKLQLVPPYEPFNVMGIKYTAKSMLPSWEIKIYDIANYVSTQPVPVQIGQLQDIIDFDLLQKTIRIK